MWPVNFCRDGEGTSGFAAGSVGAGVDGAIFVSPTGNRGNNGYFLASAKAPLVYVLNLDQGVVHTPPTRFEYSSQIPLPVLALQQLDEIRKKPGCPWKLYHFTRFANGRTDRCKVVDQHFVRCCWLRRDEYVLCKEADRCTLTHHAEPAMGLLYKKADSKKKRIHLHSQVFAASWYFYA